MQTGSIRVGALTLAMVVTPSVALASAPCEEGFKTESSTVHDAIELHEQQCKSPKYRAFVLEVDLRSDEIDFVVTPYDQRRLPTSEFAERFGAIAATNGGFWCKNWGGYTVSSGEMWPKYGDNDRVSVVGFGGWDLVKGRRYVDLRSADEVLTDVPGWMEHAVSGVPVILAAGEVQKDDYELFQGRHPRTAIGITEDRNTLFLVVVDGRTKGWSWGLSSSQLGELLLSLGAHDAVNLDGGQSSRWWCPLRAGS